MARTDEPEDPERDRCRAIAAAGIRFDQLIHEFGRWVHLSVDPRMRRNVLTIDRSGTRPGLLEVRR